MPGAKPLIDLDMPLTLFLAEWPETIAVFFRFKMLCVGCFVGPFHTICDACDEHGVDQNVFLEELQRAITLGAAQH